MSIENLYFAQNFADNVCIKMGGGLMSFTTAFRKLLEESGMSQADFARQSGFGTSYVSQLYKGKVSDPSISKAGIIARIFGLTIQELYDMTLEEE